MRKKILIIDNDPQYLDMMQKLLEREAFHVSSASNVAEASEQIKAGFFHLLLCDIRLEDDGNKDDHSGLDFIRESWLEGIARLVYSSYATFENSQVARDYVVNMVTKGDPKGVVAAVLEAFEKNISVNWDIDIQLGDQFHYTFARLARLLQTTDANDRNEAPQAMGEELAFLLGGLYGTAECIRVDRVLWHDGQRLALVVYQFQKSWEPQARLVVCGERQLIEAEHRQERKNIHRGNNTRIGDQPFFTQRYGAITYITTDGDLEQMVDLETFYRYGAWDAIDSVLTGLYGHTLDTWYEAQIDVPRQRLVAWYEQRLTKKWPDYRQRFGEWLDLLIEKVHTKQYRIERLDGKMVVLLGNVIESYGDPLLNLSKQQEQQVPFLNTPGPLKGTNIFTDGISETWLTDFRESGQVPEPQDFVDIEAPIRFDWIHFKGIEEVIAFEEQLHYDELPELDNKLDEDTTGKAVKAIRRIREMAQKVGDMGAYHVSMQYYLVERLLEQNPEMELLPGERLRLFHILRALAQLGEYTTKASEKPAKQIVNSEGPEQKSGITVDQSRRIVFLRNKEISMSVKRFKIFNYLYAHAGKNCHRQDLGSLVYKSFDATVNQDTVNLNSLILRIREQLELNPKRPKIIITVPDGYRLER